MFGRGLTKKEQKMNLDPSILLRKNQGYFTKRLEKYNINKKIRFLVKKDS